MKHDFTYKLTLGALKALARLPLWLLYGLSDVAFVILYHLVRYRRRVAERNLQRAMPELTARERKRVERRFYRHLCDVVVETVKLLHISDSEMARRVEIRGIDRVNRAAEQGRPAVVMMGHLANWEWVTCITRQLHPDFASCQIYHPLHSRLMDRVMLTLRSRFGSESIPMARTVRRLLEIEQSGKHFICGFIADQRPFTSALHNWTDFMGLDTPYVVGGETIGRKVGAEFFYADMEQPRRGHYVITFHPIVPPPADVAPNPYSRQYLRMLEHSIRRAPHLWLWSHNRWKRSRQP